MKREESMMDWQLVGHKSNRKGERPVVYWVGPTEKGMRKVRNPVHVWAPGVDRPRILSPEDSSKAGEFSASAIERLYSPISMETAVELLEAHHGEDK